MTRPHRVEQVAAWCGSCQDEWHLVECLDGHGVFCPNYNPQRCDGVTGYFQQLRGTTP